MSNTKTKLSSRFWLALTIFGFMGQVAWTVENMYFNVFMYKMFKASPADISLMVGASAVSATLTTVFMGALSDKIGKRKLFICGGYILWGISIFTFCFLRLELIEKVVGSAIQAASVGISLVIILDCLMTFFGSTANDAAFNAWVTDMTDSTNRGAAEGINSMMPMIAILAVFGGFMAFDLDKSESWVWIFAIIGICVIAVGILGLFIIENDKSTPSQSGYLKNVIYGFLPSTIKENGSLYFYLGAFIIFNISIQTFMPYLIIYYEKGLGMENYTLIMAPAVIIASAVTFFWGRFYDKRGFFIPYIISTILLVIGYIVLIGTKTMIPVFIGSLFMMCGYLCTMAVFGAKIRDLTPAGKAGMFQGVRIFSQVLIPGIIGPFVGQAVLKNAETIVNSDGTTSFIPNAYIFVAALVVLLVMAIYVKVGRLTILGGKIIKKVS
jgi:MFS family permease